MTLTLELSPDLEQRLQSAAALKGISPGDYAVQLLEEELSHAGKRGQKTAALLQTWLDEPDDGEDREAYAELTRSLDEDRPTERKLFPPELKGISW